MTVKTIIPHRRHKPLFSVAWQQASLFGWSLLILPRCEIMLFPLQDLFGSILYSDFFFVSCPKPMSEFFPLLDPCLSSPVSPSSLSCLHLLPSILSWLRHPSSHLLPLHCLSLTIVVYSCRLRCWTWLPWIEDLSFGPSFSLIPVPHIYLALKSLLPSSVYHLLGTKDW